MRITTARYYDAKLIREANLAPIGTTVGFPKFPLGMTLAGTCPMIAPVGIFGKHMEKDEFEAAYRARLDKFGVQQILTLLTAIRNGYEWPTEGVALLCFCKLEEGFCHRRMFAEWWVEQTDEEVGELADESRLFVP